MMNEQKDKESVKDSKKAGESNQQQEFEVTDNTIRDKFIKRVQKELPELEVIQKKTGRKEPNNVEPLLKFGKRNLLICAPSGTAFWSAYQFKPSGRVIVRVTDESIQNLILHWLKDRVEQLKKEQSEPKKKDKPKTEQKSQEDMEWELRKRMTECKNAGVSLPEGIKGNEEWIIALSKKKGWTVDTKKRALLKPQAKEEK